MVCSCAGGVALLLCVVGVVVLCRMGGMFCFVTVFSLEWLVCVAPVVFVGVLIVIGVCVL